MGNTYGDLRLQSAHRGGLWPKMMDMWTYMPTVYEPKDGVFFSPWHPLFEGLLKHQDVAHMYTKMKDFFLENSLTSSHLVLLPLTFRRQQS